jgi:hypothetical protein
MSKKVLINAQTGQVGSSTQMSGYPTNQALTAISAHHSISRIVGARAVQERKTVILILCLAFAGFDTAFLSGASGRLQSGQARSRTPSSTAKQDVPKKPVIEVTLQDAPRELELEFIVDAMGEGFDEDGGVHLGFSGYTASDGTKLMASYTWFFNAPEAQEYFEKQLAKAAGVIDRKKKLNSAGKVVGERAQILRRIDPQKTMPAVVWTDGRTFHEIYSSSLNSILQLEKVYRYSVPD